MPLDKRVFPLILSAGDFNSLRRDDYSEERWREIAEHRRNNRWEEPKTEVTQRLIDSGYQDCWKLLENREGSLNTCWAGTRVRSLLCLLYALRRFPSEREHAGACLLLSWQIDFVWLSPGFPFTVSKAEHVDVGPVSDHSPVVVELVVPPRETQFALCV